ncbi:MAG TPA: two-component regulator propeller domain-containing protein [Rubricoccaceae bacterium]|nr:two-component regulator propeller domain-containing protein [Rubricoccaceae bacterium]
MRRSPFSLAALPAQGAALALLGLAFAGPAPAQERHVRLFAAEAGLSAPGVRSLAQDAAGFLWIGTVGGLYRYDGIEMRRWAPDVLTPPVREFAAAPTGEVIVVQDEGDGAVFTLTEGGAAPVAGPEGTPLTRARSAAFDARGQLWVARADTLLRRDRRGAWRAFAPAAWRGARVRLVRAAPEGGFYLVAGPVVWRLMPGAPLQRMGEVDRAVDLLPQPGGRVLALTFGGEVWELTDGPDRLRFSGLAAGAPGRGIALAQRGSTLWVSIDHYLVALPSGQPPEITGTEHGLVGGGPLLVDHEGSLWMGSFGGLYQLPEPETALWTERTGLPSNHTRFLARTGDSLWVTTWQGAGYLRMGAGRWQFHTPPWHTVSRMHVGRDGTLRMGSSWGFLAIRGGRVRRVHPTRTGLLAFDEGPAGTLLLGTGLGLFRVEVDRMTPIPGLPFPEAEPWVDAVRVGRADTLWVAHDETICRAPVEAALTGRTAWMCDTIPGIAHVTAFAEMPGGTLWAATNRLGVLVRRAGRWVPLPGNRALPSGFVQGLVPSPRGGVWIVGVGMALRVTEDPAAPEGWRVHERLTGWHGLPAVDAADLLEDPDGTLWLTTPHGLVRVPPAARDALPRPPRVALVDVRVDGHPVARRAALALPHDRNRLELHFAALSFRDPGRLRYQVRLGPGRPWAEASQPTFRWVDLSPGTYRAEVRASLDGVRWSPQPATFAFRVEPPWYQRGWALLGFALAGAAALYAGYRARLAYLLGLERQRTRIATDLHDQVGSGLGSISILSGVLAGDALAEPDRRQVAHQIAATAEDLGGALSDIIWALDPRTPTLQALAERLVEHGRRLFADDVTAFTADLPETWPPEPLALPLRRAVLLVGLEALHNAARHARARHVTLRLRPDRRAWLLAVRDDGAGLPTEVRAGGRGLEGMRRRAAEIGGEIAWGTPRGGGTEVVLRFPLRPLRRPRRFLGARRDPHG